MVSEKQLSIGACRLGREPHIVVAIDRELSSEALASIGARGASLIEMRVDCFRQDIQKTVHYMQQVKDLTGLPMIGTVRENEYTKAARLSLFEKVVPVVDAVDIEIDADINGEVIEMANSKTIIVSEHDFEKTPESDSLHRIVDIAMAQGAHIAKIATMAHTRYDVTRLLRFTQDVDAPVVTMAMGELGAISRVIAPLFGSLFTYSFVAESVAPGQIALDELKEYMHRFYPAAV